MSNTQALPGPSSQSLVSRLWRGEVSLGKTYWLYGAVPNVVLRIAQVLLSAQVEASHDSSWAIAALALYVFQLFYAAFIIVCVWRSARKSRSGWARAAQAAVILSVFALIGSVGKEIEDFNKEYDNGGGNTNNEEIIKQSNVGLPKMLDDVTRLDNINIVDNNYIYSYTILTQANTGFQEAMQAKLKTGICENKTMKPFLDRYNALVYIYRAQDGSPLARVSVKKSDCL